MLNHRYRQATTKLGLFRPQISIGIPCLKVVTFVLAHGIFDRVYSGMKRVKVDKYGYSFIFSTDFFLLLQI